MEITKKNKVIIILIIVCIILSLIWYIPRAPNSDADGFIISIEDSGGTSCYPRIYYIDENGTGYYILFWIMGNITYDTFHYTDSYFEIHERYFYYNRSSDFSSYIEDVKEIINKTKFYNHDWEHHLYTGYSIETVDIIHLTQEEIDLILEQSGDVGFKWFKNKYFSWIVGVPGGGPIEMTIPYHHKSVTANDSSRPDGFRWIQSTVESYFS